jgi:hypothetical protein
LSKASKKGALMSKILSRNNPTAGVVIPEATLERMKAFDFKDSPFDVIEDGPNKCVILDTATPIDRQRVMTFIRDTVKDIYTGSTIPQAYRLGSTAGVRIINKVSDIWTITDTEDASYRVDFPVEAHTVITIPLVDLITEQDMYQQVMDAAATMFYAKDSGDGTFTATARLAKEARGIVKPPM